MCVWKYLLHRIKYPEEKKCSNHMIFMRIKRAESFNYQPFIKRVVNCLRVVITN